MSGKGPMPSLGNLAWAPLPNSESLEVFDRFNGVPTLGVVRDYDGSTCLFWQVITNDDGLSGWLYVPLTAEDEQHLASDDESDFLDTIVFDSSSPRFVTIGIALSNRLIFEREWRLPGSRSAEEVVGAFIDYATSAMIVAVEQSPLLPLSRRQDLEKVSIAMKQLVRC